MDKNKKNILFLSAIILVSFFSFFFFSNDAVAQGIVHCGRSGTGYEDRCTLCDLIIGIYAIITWGRNILIIVGVAAITIGGVMYIVSAGNEETMETAKNFIKQSLYGVAIVLGAWLIVNTTMWLLATRGDLGIGVSSWNDFNCEGGTQGSLEAIACGGGQYECVNSSPENMGGSGFVSSWTCVSDTGFSITCDYTVASCSTLNCQCFSGTPENCSASSWTCATEDETINCP